MEKRKSSPPQKSTRANPQKKTTSGKLTGGNPTLIEMTTNSSTEVIVIPDSPQKSSQDSSLPGPSSIGSALDPILLENTPEETHLLPASPDLQSDRLLSCAGHPLMSSFPSRNWGGFRHRGSLPPVKHPS